MKYVASVAKRQSHCIVSSGPVFYLDQNKEDRLGRILLFFFKKPTSSPRVTSGIVLIPPGPSQCPMLKRYYKFIPTSQFMAWLGYILFT